MKMIGLANKLKIYEAREQADKEYEENIFKNLKYLDEQLNDYFNNDNETKFDENELLTANKLGEFSGVTKNLREIRQSIELKLQNTNQLQRNYDSRALPFDHFEEHV